MILSLLLVCTQQAAPAAPAPPSARHGTLVLCDEAFELSPALARELAGDAPHALLASGALALDPLRAAAGPLRRAELDVEAGPERQRRALAALVGARAIVIESSTWLECWQLFKPEFKDSRLEQELRHAWQDGASVIACGAAASYLGSWSLVPREEVHRAVRNPRHAEPELVANGLGFFPGFMVDTASQSPAGARRLLDGTRRFGNTRALFLAGRLAWIVRDEGRAVELAGEGCAAVFDLARARRSRATLREARLVLAGPGETLALRHELEIVREDERASGSVEWTRTALARLALPLEPVRLSLPGGDYVFDAAPAR